VTGSGKAGYRWYTDTPFHWGDPLPKLSVTTDGLRIDPQAGRYNNGTWSISSVSPTTNNGTGFRFGYFEARMRFDPTLWAGKNGWPSFWAMSRPRVIDDSTIRYAEIDFFESTDHGTRYNASLHDWLPIGTRQFSDTMNTATHEPARAFDARQWNTFGCLWQPGRVRWYLNNELLVEQRYSATATPVPNAEGHPEGTYSVTDAHEQIIILGSAQGWPLEVDWVRIWQR
jgi:beta-glucanase (GH16 family)